MQIAPRGVGGEHRGGRHFLVVVHRTLGRAKNLFPPDKELNLLVKKLGILCNLEKGIPERVFLVLGENCISLNYPRKAQKCVLLLQKQSPSLYLSPLKIHHLLCPVSLQTSGYQV